MSPERNKPEVKPLTMFIAGGGTLFRAHCPELDITYYGESEEGAQEGLVELAEAEIKGILKGKGGSEDERKPLAQSLAGVKDLESLFEKVPGPGPHRAGLK